MKNARFSLGLLTLVAVTLFSVACGGDDDQVGQQVRAGDGAFTRVSPGELATMLESRDFVLVNVHVPYEGEIATTDAFIPFDTIDEELDQLPADKTSRIVVYCRSGRMSTEAAEDLLRLGYTNVWELGGGMNAWEADGRPLLHNDR